MSESKRLSNKDTIKFLYYVPKTYILEKSNNKKMLKPYHWKFRGFLKWLESIHSKVIDNKNTNNIPKMMFSLNEKNINEYFSLNKSRVSTNNYGNFGAFEWDDFKYNDKSSDLYGLDMMKLKTGNIPAIKEIGKPIDLQKITLNNQEYIAEISMILFDLQCHIAVLQKNSLGLSKRQIQFLLDRMYSTWARTKNKNDNRIFVIKFSVILDTNKVKNILSNKNTIYRSFNIKCSNTASIPEIKNGYTTMLDLGKKYDGISININISMSRSKRSKSLNKTKMINAIKQFLHMNYKYGTHFKGSIRYRNDLSSPLRNLDLLLPTLESNIKEDNEQVIKDNNGNKVKRRTAIAFEVIYEDFLYENYLEPKDMRDKAVSQVIK